MYLKKNARKRKLALLNSNNTHINGDRSKTRVIKKMDMKISEASVKHSQLLKSQQDKHGLQKIGH